MTLYILVSVGAALITLYYVLTTGIISRLRISDAPKSAFGLVRADKFSSDEDVRAHGIDVIFVHGLGSNPDTTWGPENSNIVSDFLPQDIPEKARKHARIFFYNYDSYWKRDAVQSRLSLFGESLLDHICTNIRRKDKERTRGLIFVAHSYGGLVVKQALVLAKGNPEKYAHVTDSTKSIFFLGTPHRGSNLSILGSVAAWVLLPLGSNPALLAEISDNSNSLRDLHKAFITSVSDRIQVYNFFEQRKTRIFSIGIFRREEFCVQESSATFDKADSIGLPVDHYGLNKFRKESDDYKTVMGRLANLIILLLYSERKQFLSVPPNKIETYTERRASSATVVEKLRIRHEHARVPHALAIHGLGGSGKTQLALKYIEDHKREYRTVLWIDAENEASTKSSFERCASDLQLEVSSRQDQNSKLEDHPAVRAVFLWLKRQDEIEERWLMIFDNADDVAWGLKKIIPGGSHGSILITSQDTKSRLLVDGSCEEVRIDTLEPEEARALLLCHLQLDAFRLSKEILKDCETIATKLGNLALAVGLAGAYIANSEDDDKHRALRQYLQDFSRHQDDLLKHQNYQGLSAHDKTVWSVWDTTLTRLETRFPQLRPGLLLAFLARFGATVQDEVLRLASIDFELMREGLYPHPEAAPLPEWLHKALATTGKERIWDDFYYRQSRDILVRYNLLQRVEGRWPGVSMHSLVRWRARQYADVQASEAWHLVAVVSACSVVLQESASLRFRRELLVHIPPISPRRLERLGIAARGKAIVWMILSNILYEEGLWKVAEKLRHRALAICIEVLGAEHPATLRSYASLASLYDRQGQWTKAEEIKVATLDICLKVLGPEHPDTLDNMHSLASTYWNLGRVAEVEELELKEIDVRTRVFGEEHLGTLRCMSLLAMVYVERSFFDKAEPLQTRDWEIRKRLYGENHPNTVSSQLGLAWIYNRQRRWLEAEEMEVQVLEARIELYGADHHLTLDAMAALSYTYWFQHKLSDAESLNLDVLRGRFRLFGADHPLTADSISCLATIYRAHGRSEEAEDLEAGRIDLNDL